MDPAQPRHQPERCRHHLRLERERRGWLAHSDTRFGWPPDQRAHQGAGAGAPALPVIGSCAINTEVFYPAMNRHLFTIVALLGSALFAATLASDSLV
jgi:hypothetical protein